MPILIFLALMSCAQHKAHNSANKYMHKSSHADLIKRFDDPKRDEQQRPEVVVKLLSPLANLEVIDIGVGSGYFAKYLLDAGAFVTGADVDDKFLKFVAEKFPAQNFPRFKVLKIDYNDPKMKADFYDMAFTSNTYHHIENRPEYLAKVRSGLKRTGRIVVFDYRNNAKSKSGPPHEMRVPLDQVVSELTQAGFSHITTNQEDFEDHYLIIATKK